MRPYSSHKQLILTPMWNWYWWDFLCSSKKRNNHMHSFSRIQEVPTSHTFLWWLWKGFGDWKLWFKANMFKCYPRYRGCVYRNSIFCISWEKVKLIFYFYGAIILDSYKENHVSHNGLFNDRYYMLQLKYSNRKRAGK